MSNVGNELLGGQSNGALLEPKKKKKKRRKERRKSWALSVTQRKRTAYTLDIVTVKARPLEVVVGYSIRNLKEGLWKNNECEIRVKLGSRKEN